MCLLNWTIYLELIVKVSRRLETKRLFVGKPCICNKMWLVFFCLSREKTERFIFLKKRRQKCPESTSCCFFSSFETSLCWNQHHKDASTKETWLLSAASCCENIRLRVHYFKNNNILRQKTTITKQSSACTQRWLMSPASEVVFLLFLSLISFKPSCSILKKNVTVWKSWRLINLSDIEPISSMNLRLLVTWKHSYGFSVI